MSARAMLVAALLAALAGAPLPAMGSAAAGRTLDAAASSSGASLRQMAAGDLEGSRAASGRAFGEWSSGEGAAPVFAAAAAGIAREAPGGAAEQARSAARSGDESLIVGLSPEALQAATFDEKLAMLRALLAAGAPDPSEPSERARAEERSRAVLRLLGSERDAASFDRLYYRLDPDALSRAVPESGALRALVDERHPPVIPGDWDAYVSYVETAAGAVDAGRNSLEFLIDGAAAARLAAALDGARRSVSVELFELQPDDAADAFAARLASAAARGAQVRLLLDGGGTNVGDPRTREQLARLRSAGVRVVVRPPPFLYTHLDHRKLYVVDGQTAFTGGMNVGDDFQRRWHDELTQARGPVVASLEAAFRSQWAAAGGAADGEAPGADTADVAGGARTLLIAHQGRDDHNILAAYVRAIQTAQSSIRVADPYVTDPAVLQALEAAARRGVAVQLVVPRDNNEPVVRDATRASYPDLLAAGVQVYEYQGRMAHEKVAVIDDVWSTFGSSNLDARSLADNDELNLIALDRPLAADIERRLFEADLARSERIRTRTPTLADRLARLFSGWL